MSIFPWYICKHSFWCICLIPNTFASDAYFFVVFDDSCKRFLCEGCMYNCVILCVLKVVVFHCRQLHADRESIPDVPAIYFILPTEENIQRLSKVTFTMNCLRAIMRIC